ncbi:MAG: hypothetical protein ACKO6B_12400 [Planctomycetia bacterium]
MPQPETGPAPAVALPAATQTRNLLLFSGCVGMVYLAAPVLYVGGTHAALLDQLEASSALANAPEVLYLLFLFAPLLVTSFFRHPGWLKPLLVTAYLCIGAGTALVVAAIAAGCSPRVVSAVVLAQAIINGLSLSTANALVWESLGRGVSESRRGGTLALAYGIGPILAAVGALGSQVLLTGATLGIRFAPPPAFPGNFATLFAAATVPMLVAAVLASRFVVPPRAVAAADAGDRDGLVARLVGFFGDPLLRRTAIAAVLIYTSVPCVANLTLYTREAMGEVPSDLVMYQTALRFATKAVAGLLLGWLMTKTHPLAGLLATGSLCLVTPLYACFATGLAYLATFQIYGGGELFGAYITNYVLSSSRPNHLRRNLACALLLLVFAAPFGLLFGRIADLVGRAVDPATGFRASFITCAVLVGTGLIVALTLPRRPRPLDEGATL